MKKVVCFGELLLRLVPSGNGDWIKSASLPAYVDGAEANVAVALARWQIPVAYVTAVPDNLIGKQLIEHLSLKGIDTPKVLYFGERVGIYYLPEGADLKNAGVIYDRAHSSFSQLKPGTIDWEEIFKEADWFHFSAICPAINQNIADLSLEALRVARKKGVTTSIDLNYRAKLWQYGKQPKEVMPALVEYCDIVMGNVWAAENMLGIPVDKNLVASKEKEAYLQQAKDSSLQMSRQYSEVKAIANTFRFTNEDESIQYYASLYCENIFFHSSEYSTSKVVDKVGSGDCFMAGLIYGFVQKKSSQEIIDFATTAAFQKLFVKGDSTDKSIQDIIKTIK